MAYGDTLGDFVPGMYVKEGVTFTTRGCNNKCPFCFVPEREGCLRELPIVPGNIIQDNNFLQASREHKDKVFQMLKSQKAICFKGGLQANLIDDHFIENIKKLRIKELWLACDTWESLLGFKKGCKKLTDAGYNRNKIFCYVLSYGKDMEKDRKRAIEVFNAGAMPFVQLFQPPEKIEYSQEWKDFQRQWSRPAIIKANMRRENDL